MEYRHRANSYLSRHAPAVPDPGPLPEVAEMLVADKIQIKEQLKFIVDTNILLDESRPTLLGVAEIINTSPSIGHVVIEGHASQEGSFEYNYNLSNLRARAIWKELMAAGVHPDRISYRGMGEVVPKNQGDEEEELAENRRVEFHIIDWVEENEDWPEYSETYRLPWTGETIDTVQPKRPEAEEPEEKSVEDQLDELLNPDQFLEDVEDDDDPIDEEVAP